MTNYTSTSSLDERALNPVTDKTKLELETSKQLLEALFGSRASLMLGYISQLAVLFISWWTTSDRNYFYIAFIASFVFAARRIQMSIYDRSQKRLMSDETSKSEIDLWYKIYMSAATATSVLLGGIAGYSVYYYPESWASLVCLALPMASMVSVVGRNFANETNILLTTTGILLPMATALVAHAINKGQYVAPLGLAMTFIPFAMSVKSLSHALYLRFKKQAEHMFEIESLRNLFRAAVSNMPNGLIMVNDAGIITFANSNMATMLKLDSAARLKGKKLHRLVDFGRKLGTISAADAPEFKSRLLNIFEGRSTSETLHVSEDFVLEFSIRTGGKTSSSDDDNHGLVIVCEDVTERWKAEEKIRHSANYDMLSSLPNRRHMRDLVDAAIERSPTAFAAVCVFDVDKFKTINDTQGHLVGDEVIKCVARSMSALKDHNPDLLISRFGGDEFVMVLPGLSHDFDVKRFFDNAFSIICTNYEIMGKGVEVRCSGGVIVLPHKDFSLETAVQKSDSALYKVKSEKREYKNRNIYWHPFDAEMEETHRNTQQMQRELVKAVDLGQIILHYQPMVTPDGQRIDTCEALCRWNHPELGLLAPTRFIDIAEKMNIIGEVTRQVIETACRDCARWDDKTCVSVNLSALDLANLDIVDTILQALRKSGLDPKRLQVEITESVFLKDMEIARQVLLTLRTFGVKTAIDDFGTGYSNLATLGDLPIDKIKIDRSFIHKLTFDEKSRKLFEAVVSLGRNMGLGVVVEGVEKPEQLELVVRNKIDLIQGYLFGKPMPHEAIAEMIASRNPDAGQGKVVPFVPRGSL